MKSPFFFLAGAIVSAVVFRLLGPFWGGPLILAFCIGMHLKFRRDSRIRHARLILRTLSRYDEGAIARPGLTTLIGGDFVSVSRQWQLANQLANDGLIAFEKLPPRHYPPDVTGVVMTITPEGKKWLAAHPRKPILPVVELN